MANEGEAAIGKIADQIVGGLDLTGPAQPVEVEAPAAPAPAAPSAAPAAPAAPATPPRDPKTGQFQPAKPDAEKHLANMREIVKGAVAAQKRAEAAKTELERQLESMRIQPAQPVVPAAANLDQIIADLQKSGQLSDADAQHYRGAGRTIVEAMLKANRGPTVDQGLMDEFKEFSRERKFLKQAGDAFDIWRGEKVASGDEDIADPDMARAVLKKWNSGSGVLTAEAFDMAYQAARFERGASASVADAEGDAAREAARAAAGATTPADMGSGAPADSVKLRRERIREAGQSGRHEDVAPHVWAALGGDSTFFPDKKE